MTEKEKRPDVERTLSRLKDFQRQSVEYIYRRLYEDSDKINRFLIADEVGLGKTLVAKGVIAKAVDKLWDEVERIDIIKGKRGRFYFYKMLGPDLRGETFRVFMAKEEKQFDEYRKRRLALEGWDRLEDIEFSIISCYPIL